MGLFIAGLLAGFAFSALILALLPLHTKEWLLKPRNPLEQPKTRFDKALDWWDRWAGPKD
jgi:hypothetical protein